MARVERSRLGPQITGEVQTAPNPQSDEDASYSAGFRLSWELDLFGKLRRADEAARAQLLASEDTARGVMTTLVADVASTWFELRELDEEVQIISDTIKSQQESLDAGAVLEPQRRRVGHRGAAGGGPARDHPLAVARRGAQPRAGREPPAFSARLSAGSHFPHHLPAHVPRAAGDPGRAARYPARETAGRAAVRAAPARRNRARGGRPRVPVPVSQHRGHVVLRPDRSRPRRAPARG